MRKKSIYYYDVGNTFRPNKDEIDSNQMVCPKCKQPIFHDRHRSLNPKIRCPNCGFSIDMTHVLDKDQIPDAMQRKRERRRLRQKTDEGIIQDIVSKHHKKKVFF